jgi:hypothetical protein
MLYGMLYGMLLVGRTNFIRTYFIANFTMDPTQTGVT